MISSFQIHSKGLKFGIYGDIGTRTCKNYPGNQYYIPLDAETYASWGVDMLKLDCCFTGYNMVEGIYCKILDLLMSIFSQTANQNTVSNKYFILIGQFWSMSTIIILKSFMTIRPGLNIQ